MKASAKGVPLLLVAAVLVACVAYMMSVHAQTAHAEQLWSSAAVFDAYDQIIQTPGNGGPCRVLEISACPFATNHDKRSPYFGAPSPQARAYCEMRDGKPGYGIMPVFGLGRPGQVVRVTGYYLPYTQWQNYNRRDLCLASDITYLQYLMDVSK